MLRRVVVVFMVATVAAALAVAGGTQEQGRAAVSAGGAAMKESPMLRAMVEAGELPPLEERLPENPHVVEVVNEIGRHGGTLYGAGIGFDGIRDTRQMIGMDKTLYLGPDGVEPGYAEFEMSSDAKTLTLYFREGMKWSDGEPFSAEDMVFWYEDILLEEDLTPAISSYFTPGGEVFDMVKVDEYTLQWKFAEPHPNIVFLLAHSVGTGLHWPKHYLSQFHKNYVSEEDMADLVAETEGANTWYDVFNMNRARWFTIPQNKEMPTIGPYMVDRRRTDGIDFVRNPYYWRVDPEGNQLPYIDRIHITDVANVELFNAKVVSGEIDLTTGFQTSAVNLPLYKQGEQEGLYDLLMWNTADSSDIFLTLNPYPEDPVLQPVFFDKRFRQAVSLAVNRQEIIDVLFFGLGQSVQVTNIPESSYYQPEFQSAYADYDPARANDLLDDMGLEWDSRNEYRLRPDGSGPLGWTITYLRRNESWIKTAELCVEYWKELGLDVKMKEVGQGLYNELINANEVEMTVWHADDQSEHRFTFQTGIYTPYDRIWHTCMARPWNDWFNSEGESGVEPPSEIKRLGEWVEIMRTAVDDEDRIEAGREILEYQAEHVMSIGIARIPKPVVRNKALGNVPEKATTGWDFMGPAFVYPQQYYLKAPRNQQ
jgi:peptide/nickel transport system substrate-binding protein